MRRWIAGLVLASAVVMPGCGVDPNQALQNHYNTSLPSDVRVVHFTGDAFKDPWFVWELTPVRPAFVKQLVANAKLKTATTPTPRQDSYSGSPGNVSWWPAEALGNLGEMYHLEADSSIWRVWVDPGADRLWVLFINN